MIERHWKGVVKPGEEHNYIQHLLQETFPKITSIDGFIRASILKRAVGEGTEFLVITIWKSLDIIKQFAGENIDVAVVPEVAQKMMVKYEKTVAHYEIATLI